VSPHRYTELIASNWYAQWEEEINNFYAVRMGNTVDGKKYPILMHRQIMGLERGDTRQVDHRDRSKTLDNTDENLRIATAAQQAQNQKRRRDNTSGYKGVSFFKRTGRWLAQIQIDGKKRYLGYHDTAELAYAAYCKAATENFGEFARLL
jgi:hypothetical protein